ncbi:MAG: hypothetical protein QM503_10610 [Bacteroidota bacterium]
MINSTDIYDIMDKIVKVVCETTGVRDEMVKLPSGGSEIMDAKCIIARICDFEEISRKEVGLYIWFDPQASRRNLNRFHDKINTHIFLNAKFNKCFKNYSN